MKRMLLVICLGLVAITAYTQYDERDRLASTNPLRNGDGSFMKANNPLFFNNTSNDTMWSKKRLSNTTTAGNSFAFRVNSLQALCDLNSLQLNWTSIQRQPDADRFEIEQSADGGITWTNIGTVPASKYQEGNGSYNFVYNKKVNNVDLRVAAVSATGEKRYSAVVRSACNGNNLLSVDDLVYSTTHIRISSIKSQNVRIIVTNSSGVPVQVRQAGVTQGVNSISLDMSALNTGVYTLTVVWPGDMLQSMQLVKR